MSDAQGTRTELAGTGPSLAAAKAARRLRKRRRAEIRFQAYGIIAITLAVLALGVLLVSILGRGLTAFVQTELVVELDFRELAETAREDPGAVDISAPVRDILETQFPSVESRSDKRRLFSLLSSGVTRELRARLNANPDLFETPFQAKLPVDSLVDMYRKGKLTGRDRIGSEGVLDINAATGTVDLSASANDFKAVITAIRRDLRQRSAAAERRAEVARNRIERLQEEAARLRARGGENMEEALSRLQSSIASLQLEVRRREGEARSLRQEANRPNFVVNLSNAQPSYLVFMNEGVVKLQEVRAERATGQVLVPLNSTATAARGDWYMLELSTPEGDRRFKDQAIAWVEKLEEAGLLKTNFNHRLFTNASSQEPELAGLAGALSGTFWTMLVTLILSFPIGVAAAIYLEEFAPKNRLTDLIEVNINNLAAVPSIVFGLLGLAVFLNTLGLPRSSPLVGGMVLALMTLPTIIIASRAALKAVPPSVRQAALGLGASRVQTTFQQVVPQALPGIFTGSIIGMAQALGETAPLLMIGMVAFIAEVPGGISDPAAVMPVQIFLWSGEPERAFAERTSAAILVLLGFLVVMNAIAVILRRRFEQRWT